ncbi:MAG TPA: cellulase family glycosylhydrolase [Polyangiaceae bacterium]
MKATPSPRPGFGRLRAACANDFSGWLVAGAALLALGCLKTPNRTAVSALDVRLSPPENFELEGRPFCFVGANNYYLAYKPRPMVDDVLSAAKALGFRVMRMWGFIDIGSIDGSRKSIDDRWENGKKDGAYFQYWDGKLNRPVYNDGDDGLKRLDYAIARAGELGIKITYVLTNNWNDFGGIAQYLEWFGKKKHHEFYTDPEIKQAYKNWVAHIVNRRNTVNGRLYRDDPTIFAWELANEPRCKGTGAGSPGWTLETIPRWVAEMSAYIKSLDPNHMVAVGDEGFLDAGGEHWAYAANDGVDHEALTAVPTIDFGTFHLYPEHWDASLEWGQKWIVDHLRVARRLGKPTILEEYGIKVGRDAHGNIVQGLEERLHHYRLWNEAVLMNGGNGAMPWILSGIDVAGGVYEDYDRFTLYRGDETAALLREYARRFTFEAPACVSAEGRSAEPPSPFVRVRGAGRRGVERVGFGWGYSRG